MSMGLEYQFFINMLRVCRLVILPTQFPVGPIIHSTFLFIRHIYSINYKKSMRTHLQLVAIKYVV